jgi:hypothetical protein
MEPSETRARRPRVICHMMASLDGRVGRAALFDVADDGMTPRRLALEHVEQRPGDTLWLRYRVE